MKQQKLKKFFASVLIFTVSFKAQGMSLKECFQAAKNKNETIGIQSENVRQAEETRKQAIGVILPTITGSYSYLWQKDVQTGFGTSISPSYQPLGKITATQPIFQGFREYSGLSQTKNVLRAQEQNLSASYKTLYQNLAQVYYTILSYQKDLTNLELEVRYYDERIAELSRFRAIGRAQEVDVLNVRSAKASLLASLEQIKGQLLSARQSFALLTGLAADTQLTETVKSLPEELPPIARFLSNAETRPDVRASSYSLKAAEDALWIAKEGHLPSVNLTYNRYLQRSGILSDVDWDAQIQISIPIFSGGITQSKVRQADSQREQAELTLSQTRRAADQEILSLHALAASDLRQIAHQKSAVKISEQAFKEEKRQYRLGLVTNLEVLQALTSFIEATRNLDKSQYDFKMNYERLRAASSNDFDQELGL